MNNLNHSSLLLYQQINLPSNKIENLPIYLALKTN